MQVGQILFPLVGRTCANELTGRASLIHSEFLRLKLAEGGRPSTPAHNHCSDWLAERLGQHLWRKLFRQDVGERRFQVAQPVF